MGASWGVLKQDKEILIFPILSGICCSLVLASFAIPILVTEFWRPPNAEAEIIRQIAYYGTLFAFYLCNYFVITFFNTALISCAMLRLNGGDPTVAYGLKEALRRAHLIASWALVSATVGMILRVLEERSNWIGKIVLSIVGVVWSVASFFVVPAMVVKEIGPLDALKESSKLIKRTWGELLVGSFSFGSIFALLSLPALGMIGLGIYLLVTGGTSATLFLVEDAEDDSPKHSDTSFRQ